MKAKKHRVVLEISTNVPMTEKDVRNGVDLLLDRLGDGHWRRRWLKPWANNGVERLKVGGVKAFTRVFRSEVLKKLK